MAQKFNQVGIHTVNVSDIVAAKNFMVVPEAAQRPIAILESRFVRQALGGTGYAPFMPKKERFVVGQDDEGNEVAREILVADMFIIVKVDQIADGSDMVEAIFTQGFWSQGKHYRYVMSSPAQDRTSKAVFTTFDPNQVRRDVTYNAIEFQDITTPIVLAKREARYGIGMSSTKEVIGDFTYAVITDAECDMMLDGKFMNSSKRMQVFNDTRKTNLTDGQGYCSIKYAAFMAQSLKIIRASDYPRVEEAFNNGMTISEMMTDASLSKIVAKIPMVWQIRYAGAKGILVVWEFRGQSVTEIVNIHDKKLRTEQVIAADGYDVLFTEGMWKYTPDPNYHLKPTMEVASWLKKAKGPGYLNYQFIQGLDISGETLISIAKDALSYLEDGVLKDYDKAMKFLGVINYQGEDDALTADVNEDTEFEKISSRSKVVEALMRNPAALHDRYIQKNLRYLCKTFIEDMRQGRIPLENSAFRFIVRDPFVTFGGQPKLGKGQAYYNGHVGAWAAFRSPAIHRSEYIVMNMVNMTEYKHLTDCVILNAHDDWAARAGGADFDGDKMFVTDDQRIVSAVPGGKVIYAEGDAGKSGKQPPKFIPNWQNIIRHKIATLGQDMIGILTNIATTVIDYMNCKRIDPIEGNENVEILRVLQGMAIDSAKTGDRVNIQEYPQFDELRKMQPHWLEPKKGSRTVMYKSTAPLGKLYDFIMGENYNHQTMKAPTAGYLAEFLKVNVQQGGDFRLDLPAVLDLEEVQRVKPLVKRLEEMYCEEISVMMALERHMMEDLKHKNNMTEADVEKEINGERQRIYEKYAQMCATINADPRSVAGAAYLIAYGKQTQSVSFPWIACTQGMMLLMSDLGKDISYKLVPVRTGLDLSDTEELTFVVGRAIDMDELKGLDIRANVADGTYPIVMIEERWFVKVPFVLKPISTQYHVGNRVAFQIKGAEYQGLASDAEALKLIAQAGGEGELRKSTQNGMTRLLLHVGGRPVAATQFSAKEYDDFEVAQFHGMCVKIDIDHITKQLRNPKLKHQGLYTMDACITACLIDAQQAVVDYVIRTAWYWQMERIAKEELKFTDVRVQIADELAAGKQIGRIAVQFNGNYHPFDVYGEEGGIVRVDAQVSDKAQAFMNQFFSEALGQEVRRRRHA